MWAFGSRLRFGFERGAAPQATLARAFGPRFRVGLFALIVAASVLAFCAHAQLPEWMQHVVGASSIEAALYRAMPIPGGQTLYPRPPKEAAAQLSPLIAGSPAQAELYSLRAMEEEQALDFGAAETDWKAFAAHPQDAVAGELALADFYHRRLRPADEAAELMLVGRSAAPATAAQNPADQRSWQAFERLLSLAAEQALPDATVQATYVAWMARYPDQPAVDARYLHWLLEKKLYAEATALIVQYRRAFPQDSVFPVKAAALIELSRGDGDPASVARALAVYEAAFQPLWPGELVDSFFSLLAETHQQRRFLADARAQLGARPDDLNALARIFFYYRQQGRLDAAEQEADAFRLGKEARGAAWSAADLYTLAAMMQSAGAFPEAARYDFALYHAAATPLPDGRAPQEAGLAGVIDVLLRAPDRPIALGAGNLSMYRDIATLDRGPGYWNGILSLWFNSTEPAREFSEEEAKAQPYFRRQKAAELLALLDRTIPAAAERPELHAQLIAVYVDYGQTAEVIAAGQEFLREFANAPERLEVANQMADAYARTGDTHSEFALYDRMLQELAAKAGPAPLTVASGGFSAGPVRGFQRFPGRARNASPFSNSEGGEDAADEGAPNAQLSPSQQAARSRAKNSRAFEIATPPPAAKPNPAAAEYAELLNRYLGRLTTTRQIPQALALLRHQLDRNPGDSMLYERLAEFLGQNNLSAQEEEVYRLAMGKFDDRSWYDRLARLYLRERKREAFSALTKQVTDTFAGTELDSYFRVVPAGGPPPGPAMYLELNLYAAKRFPHDEVFVRNLLQAYRAPATRNQAAWEALLRRHWWDSDSFRTEFFDYLSRTGKLDAELAQLQAIIPRTAADAAAANPAAARELAEIDLWDSHFEQSAPLLGTLAAEYPADPTLGGTAVSVFRSLAYYDPADTPKAVAAEKNLLAANPYDTELLATLGDLYAEQKAGGHEDLAAAGPFWRRIPSVHPASADGYLTAATIFWDYFDFSAALSEIDAARVKFHRPALYGYEAGAIAEGQRDPATAVEEYTAAALAASGGSEARGRLLQLARRTPYKAPVDAASARALAQNPGSAEALGLRADVLTALDRQAEIAPLLASAVARAATVDDAAVIARIAQAHNLAATYETALAREGALTSDPVEKIELAYAQARSLEGRHEIPAAQQVIDAVYADNPMILGVVRATVDFDWRTAAPQRPGERQKAIAVLLEAAQAAQPALRSQFTLEAANKADESGDTAQARSLAVGLLAESPFDPQYVAAAAESYARAGDDAGLKQFYLDRLAMVRTAPGLTPDARKQDTVLLRRGLIPALTRMKDAEGAVAQYIAILSTYPEDLGAAQEAALYALQYGRQDQLLGFLRKTVYDSPQDSRFAILLAQAETTFDDLPAAITAYSRAIATRKDRVDLYTARAALEERLQRFDEACADFDRLYVLTYKDPSWMVKEAELRARQGRTGDVLHALEIAWITGRPAAARNLFLVADQLDKWNLLPQAADYAQRGLQLAGDDLLLPSNTGTAEGDAAIYARIAARVGEPDRALTTLLAARKAAAILPASLTISDEALRDAHLTLPQWRRMETQQRESVAQSELSVALNALATTVGADYTPEQKLAYARVLDADRASSDLDLHDAIGQATLAGLKDREAAWRREALMAADVRGDGGGYQRLQRSRMQFSELARTLEAYAQRLRPALRQGSLVEAADAYREAGDSSDEMRLLQTVIQQDNTSLAVQLRYLALVLERAPAQLPALAASKDEAFADLAANLAIAKAPGPLAWSTLQARAQSMPPLWRRAYTALVGLFLGDKTPRTETAFRDALDVQPIGERVGHPLDRTQQLAGDPWFYYGMRYGVYRSVSGEGDPEDYLPAELERSPAAEGSYTTLAQAYADADKTDAALAEYAHALEIAPDDVSIHDDIALIEWSAGRKDAALAEWRTALAALNRIEERGPAPETFWSTFSTILDHLKSRDLAAVLRSSIDGVVRPYLVRNGSYRSNELLAAVFHAATTPAEGTAWLLSLAEAAKPDDQLAILGALGNAAWIPVAQREPLYLRQIELARAAAAGSGAASRLPWLQESLVLVYVGQREDAKARAALDAIPAARRNTAPLIEARLALAARGGNLNTVLAGYRADPNTAPASEPLHAAVRLLLNPETPIRQDRQRYFGEDVPAAGAAQPSGPAPDWQDARALLEYLLERAQRTHSALTADYIALAEARLHTDDAAGAITLLQRMTTSAADPNQDIYSACDAAANLLERESQPAAAIEFLQVLVQGVPWDTTFRLRLGEAQSSAGTAAARSTLRSVAASPAAPYDLRIRAAEDLGRLTSAPPAATLGSGELDLLAAGSRDVAAARQPYFAIARIAAASSAPTPAARAEALLESVAIAPSGPESDQARLGIFAAESEAGNNALAAASVETAAGVVSLVRSIPEAQLAQARSRRIVELDRAGLEAQLATVEQRLGRESDAARTLGYAIASEPGPTRRAALTARRDAILQSIALDSINAVRRPVVSKFIDQSNLVRPRLASLPQNEKQVSP